MSEFIKSYSEEEKIKNSVQIFIDYIFMCKHGIHITKGNCDKCYEDYLEKLKET